jgi:Arc/MetJ-type ribon-helix-helix transcriptional regulator
MLTTFAVRLDPQTRSRLARVARRNRQTVSEAIRQAITLLIQTDDSRSRQLGPYVALADLLGVVRGGDRERSTRRTPRLPRGRK